VKEESEGKKGKREEKKAGDLGKKTRKVVRVVFKSTVRHGLKEGRK
jgi:hypothetical protein